jgi:predicted AlkP superfamily phosphohydrolase/phosphomutase
LSEGTAAPVFVLGLDGATRDLLGPLLEAGRLPNLKRLAAEGAAGPLLSTVPPTSPVAWSTFVTGKNPGKHGIYDFLEFSHQPLGGRVNSSRHVNGDTIWEIATRAGRRTAVAGVALTYPPRPHAGLQIGDFLSPPGVRDLSSDPALLEELERELGPYPPWCTASYHRGNEMEVLGRLRAFLDYHLSAIRFLLERSPWDLFCYNLIGVDRIHHELWHVFDESHPFRKGRQLAEEREALIDFFSAVDGAVGDLRRRLPSGGTLLVMSDHGNGAVTHYLNLNLWLLREGYIVLRPGARVRLKRWLFERGKNPAWAYRRLARLGFADLVQGRLQGGQLGWLDKLTDRLFLSRRDIDWPRTRAYAQGNYGQIFLNLRGRQPQGRVAPGEEAETLTGELRAKLLALVSPETGERLVSEVLLPREVYQGPLSGLAPDLRVTLRDPRHHTVGLFDFTSHKLLMRAFSMSGDHRPEGVLFAGGGPILAGSTPRAASLADLAPTILHLMGIPIPSDMDGRVLEEILSPAARRPPVYAQCAAAEPENGAAQAAVAGEPVSEAEEAQVRRRLKDLGYL